MKKKNGFFIWKQKSYVIAGLLALIAVVAMAGMGYRDKKEDADDTNKEQPAYYLADDAQKEVETMADQTTNISEDKDDQGENNTLTGAADDISAEDVAETGNEAAGSEETKAVLEEIYPEDPEMQEEDPIAALHFPGEGALLWPVSGNVIMDYSMDRTIYFSTLDQYRNNPAIMIQGEINDPVAAACAGQVIDISTNEVTGCVVIMDMGDGYQAVYGQLKELECEMGDYLEAGQTIGYLSEPTKYFVKEGCNLYFQINMNGEPLNPMIYLGQDNNGA